MLVLKKSTYPSYMGFWARLQKIGRKKTLPMTSKPTNKNAQQTEEMLRQRFLAERDKFFNKTPKKRDLLKHAMRWGSTSNYTMLQNKKRAGMNIKDPYGYWKDHANMRKFNAGLRMYLNKVALRAPAMPKGVRNFETGSRFPNLYRGVAVPDPRQIVGAKEWRDLGFMAFSRNQGTSMLYAIYNAAQDPNSVIVLFRMNVRDVPPGTPWIWFKGQPETQRWRTASFVHTDKTGNNEVMLPPGVLRIKKLEDTGRTWIHTRQPDQPFGKTIVRRLFKADVEYRPVSEHVPFTVLKAVGKFKSGLRRPTT